MGFIATPRKKYTQRKKTISKQEHTNPVKTEHIQTQKEKKNAWGDS